MSKFKMPGSRLLSGADAWVANATEAEAKTSASQKPAQLTIDLPPELHARFKATCALRKTKMIDEVRQFIEEWTQKYG